jgi:hypothetical protein
MRKTSGAKLLVPGGPTGSTVSKVGKDEVCWLIVQKQTMNYVSTSNKI